MECTAPGCIVQQVDHMGVLDVVGKAGTQGSIHVVMRNEEGIGADRAEQILDVPVSFAAPAALVPVRSLRGYLGTPADLVVEGDVATICAYLVDAGGAILTNPTDFVLGSHSANLLQCAPDVIWAADTQVTLGYRELVRTLTPSVVRRDEIDAVEAVAAQTGPGAVALGRYETYFALDEVAPTAAADSVPLPGCGRGFVGLRITTVDGRTAYANWPRTPDGVSFGESLGYPLGYAVEPRPSAAFAGDSYSLVLEVGFAARTFDVPITFRRAPGCSMP